MEVSVAWLLICGVVSVGTLIFCEMFLWFRNLIPKSVQCWFCHHKTEVPYQLSNRWHCPKCEQYNGFNSDGDYNKTIQQQYDEKLNFPALPKGGSRGVWRRENVLCSSCNQKQDMKVQQLASFEPINPKKYDSEVEHFRAQIEKACQLCANCELLVNGIFRKEREQMGVPRRLNALTAQKAAKGTGFLFLQLLLAAALALLGFVQSNAALSLKAAVWPLLLPHMKKLPQPLLTGIRSSSLVILKSTTVISRYVLLAGIVSCLIAYYRSGRQSMVLLFNALLSLALLGISLGYPMDVELFSIFQGFVGLTSFTSALYVLKNIYGEVREYQQRQQMMLVTKKPRNLTCTPTYVPTSTPRASPPESPLHIQPFNYADSFVSVRSRETGKASLRDVGLEPGIRGLTLGSSAREDDVRSLWNGSVVQSTFSHPNASSWTSYSSPAQLTTQSVPVNFHMNSSPLQHIYSPVPGHKGSRPNSPGSALNRTTPPLNNSFTDYSHVKNRSRVNTIIAPPSFR